MLIANEEAENTQTIAAQRLHNIKHDNMYTFLSEEAKVVRKIYALYIQGNGLRKIKRYLGDHGIQTVTSESEWLNDLPQP